MHRLMAAGSRRAGVAGVVVLLAASALIVEASARQTVFRSSVDRVVVDVQVLDRNGYPISALDASRFEVSIGGARRQVVSVDVVGSATVSGTAADRPSPFGASAINAWPSTGGGRIFVLAIDSASFEPAAWQRTALAARGFVSRLDPADQVVFYAYPFGPTIGLTSDRGNVMRALSGMVGGSSALRTTFHLTASEIIDISAENNRSTSPGTAVRRTRDGALDPGSDAPTVRRVQDRECPNDSNCSARILMDADNAASRLEARASQSVAGLQSMLTMLSAMPGRKTVVLLSAGMAVSDVPGGRPQADDVARSVGQGIAQANAVIYTLHIDSTMRPLVSAAQQRIAVSSGDLIREASLMGRWLEQFSVASGGSLLRVQTDDGEGAFGRVLRESSAYYLLGVEPAPADRDGRLRELKVRVHAPGATVRHRNWVIVPKG